jgi:hypothetical protein
VKKTQPNQHSKREIELAGLLTPRERVWATIRRFSKRKPADFTALEIQDACLPLVNFSTVRNLLDQFAQAGALTKQAGEIMPGKGSRRTTPTYTLAQDALEPPASGRGNKAAHAQGVGRLAMWRAMKVLKSFSAAELAQAASAGTVRVAESSAAGYMAALAKAGLLKQRDTRGLKVNKGTRYMLINWTGARAPIYTSAKCVVDRNTGAVTLLASAQEMVDAQE